MMLEFNVFFDQQIIEPLAKLPPLYIQNGQVTFDKPMPYFVKNKEGKIVSIIDTTGEVKTIDGKYPDLTTLITKNKFFYRVPSPKFFFTKQIDSSNNQVFVQALSTDINQVFDGKNWINSSGIKKVKLFSQVIIYPTVALVIFVIYLVFLLVFALMGQLLAKLFLHIALNFKQTTRLLIVSATPQVFTLLFGLTVNWIFTGFGLLLITLLAVYFIFAVRSLKRESHKLVVS